MCWRRLFKVPWTARRSNQSILKEISPGCSLEGLLKLKLQYFGHLMRKADSFEKTLMLGKIEGRRRGQERMRWLDGITDSVDLALGRLRELGDGQGGLACCSSWGRSHYWATEMNWKCEYSYLLSPFGERIWDSGPLTFSLTKHLHSTFQKLYCIRSGIL